MAGVAKCGTTDLYKRIRYHPEIMEGELKEYHWWDRLRYGAPMELKFTKDSEKNESELFDHTPSIVFFGTFLQRKDAVNQCLEFVVWSASAG